MNEKIVVAIDTETELIRPGKLAPRLACVSYAFWSYSKDRIVTGLLKDREEIKANIGQWLRGAAGHEGAVRIVGHNTSYDMAVLAVNDPSLLPFIFEAYEKQNIDDTQIREQLRDIANGTFWKKRKVGGYTLQALAKENLNLRLSKGSDTWRLRYGELINRPLEEWPEDAKQYALNDAETTLKVFLEQGEVPNAEAQAAAAWGLHLMSCWGVVTHPGSVEEFLGGVASTMTAVSAKLKKTGIMRGNGSKNLTAVRRRVSDALGAEAKRTNKGSISTNEETLVATGDPDLALLVQYSKAQKLDSVWARYLRQGTNPRTPVQASFHCLVESGRTSCSKPNLQNPHRATGLRECFVPRKGNLFVSCDYSTLELRTLAQINTWLFNDCNMATRLQDGADLHLHFAAQLLGIDYSEAERRLAAGNKSVKTTRQIAKVANFGYPGGMGASSFRSYAKGYGLDISEEFAEQLRRDWFKAWPEMESYFDFVHHLIGQQRGSIEQFVSKRVRGDVNFTQACNSFFQGLAADGAKSALFETSRQAYTNPDSPLYGSRPVMFIHDEIVLESPASKAPQAGDELSRIMREEMQKYTPDIPIQTDVAVMERWHKDAEEVRNSDGVLQTWAP